ncbi:MAG: hypothetical protein L6U99_12745 [Clostridium sp.]|nr:MAG: hypothetical protein L6U99_12745 [Clostridium sp.]
MINSNIKTNKKRILILGGSLGSKFMREVAEKACCSKKKNEEIVFLFLKKL